MDLNSSQTYEIDLISLTASDWEEEAAAEGETPEETKLIFLSFTVWKKEGTLHILNIYKLKPGV